MTGHPKAINHAMPIHPENRKASDDENGIAAI
jgi:hypothetical protein